MELPVTQLLQPLDGGAPCGPDVRELDAFLTLRTQVDQLDRAAAEGAPSRVDWARQRDRILKIAGQTRDLRVWVWLAAQTSIAQSRWDRKRFADRSLVKAAQEERGSCASSRSIQARRRLG